MRVNKTTYVGIYNDTHGGMTETGRIVRDAWVFELIPETQTCEGWLPQGLEDLWRRVNDEWEKYGFLVNNLPPDIRERFIRIQKDAMARAKAAGWDPDGDLQDET